MNVAAGSHQLSLPIPKITADAQRWVYEEVGEKWGNGDAFVAASSDQKAK